MLKSTIHLLPELYRLREEGSFLDACLIGIDGKTYVHLPLLIAANPWLGDSIDDCDQVHVIILPDYSVLELESLAERIDYVFAEESDQKTFRDKVANLPTPQELVLEMKSVPKELLLHREAPVLSEEELLLICSESLAEKSFDGFSVRLVEAGDEFRFEFRSMTTLNMFLVNAVGYKDCFLGEIRKRAAAVSPQLKSIKKYGKEKYPLLVKLDSELDLEGIGSKYNCKMFTRIKDVAKKNVTIDFKHKCDLYRFVTSEEVEFYFNVKFTAIE